MQPPRHPPFSRLPGLDWLRAGGTICVVMLHAGMAYCTHPMPGIVWAAYDRHPSPWIDALTWAIDLWVMPLFFLMSGFLAARLTERYGPGGLIRHRLLRIGGPLLFGIVFILPLDLYAWLLSWVNQGFIEPVKMRSLKIASPLGDSLWGLSHLWYLEYLLLFCLLAGILHSLRNLGNDRQNPVRPFVDEKTPRARINSLSTPALLSVAVVMLWLQPRVLIGFRHSFFPLPENFVFFAAWFTMGWRLPAQQHAPDSRTAAAVRLAAAGAGFAVLLPMIHHQIERESIPAANLALPALFVMTSWLATTGLFQLALSMQARPGRLVAYVSEASFWIYLLHHPVVALAQGDMAHWNWPAELKAAVAGLLGLAVPLLTYRVWVRGTWIGLLLNGRPGASRPPAAPVLEPAVRRRAA